MADTDKTAPSTWGQATRMLRTKGEGNVTDADIFADPNAPKTDKSNPLGYLGHFANDDVAADGHNVGKKPLGIKRVGDGKIAGKGYRVIEGNHCTPVCTPKMKAKRDHENAEAARAMGFKPSSPYEAPPVEKAPLRKAARAAKNSAKPAIGPLRSKKR